MAGRGAGRTRFHAAYAPEQEPKKKHKRLAKRFAKGTKRRAVQAWEARHLRECEPEFLERPQDTLKFGWLYHDLPSSQKLKSSPQWHQFSIDRDRQVDRERDPRPQQAAMKWLERHASKAIKARLAPAFKAEVTIRLKLVGWSMAQLKREAKRRGWV